MATLESALLALRVIPKSAQDAVVGWHGDALKIKVRAVPENGRANAAVVELLAKALYIPQKSVIIESGQTSRTKRVRIVGLDQTTAKARLNALFSE